MKFTFGICSSKMDWPGAPGYNDRLKMIISSIEKESIPEYEIIVVGNVPINGNKIRYIPFYEERKPRARKKNIIAREASFENVVFMHDYVILEKGWYEGYLNFGGNFTVCMNKVHDMQGKRILDWLLLYEDHRLAHIKNKAFLLPYEVTHLSKYMHIPGFYWVAKKKFMNQYQFNEFTHHNDDVEWSKRIRNKCNFSINTNSIVRLIRPRTSPLTITPLDAIQGLK